MDYREYKNSRDLAWRILVNEGVRELPVQVGKLCSGMGIRVAYFTPEAGGRDGFSLMLNGKMRIMVSNRKQHKCCVGVGSRLVKGWINTS